jgi:uncharacterized protein (DUF2147 family)
MTRLSLLISMLCLNAAAADVPSAAVAYPAEYWVSRSGGWSVKTAPCESGLCAYLVSFKLKPSDPPNFRPLDVHNPNPSRRGERLCGHIMMGGFHPSSDAAATWDGGWIYDPDSGRTYSGKITFLDQHTVKLRGYIGISLLGRTLILDRQTAVPNQCEG